MFDFKTYILKHFSKVKVMHRIPGRLRLKVPAVVTVGEEFRDYDKLVINSVKILPGVNEISFNYVIGTVLLTYDTKKTYEEKVLAWINKVVEVVVASMDFIEKYAPTNLQYVIDTLEQKLKQEVKKL